MGEGPESIERVDEGWRPRGELDIERALRGLERLAARWASIDAQADAFAADVEAWRRIELDRLRNAGTGIVLGIQSWARDRRLASSHRDKTFGFPSGSVETKALPTRTDVVDEAALLAWCREGCPEAIKTVESVLKSVVMKLDGIEVLGDGSVVLSGERIPGLLSVPAHPDRFRVEVKLASARALPAATDG